MADPYIYPGTSVLINKLKIANKQHLIEYEIRCTSRRLMELAIVPIKGRFGFTHLKKIHQYIFQDIYDWAGKIRTVDIGKGNLFCPVQNIPSYAEDIFRNYAKDCRAAASDPDLFIKTLAGHYADLNALHPFREGNGRTQREFARELCISCGYSFSLTHTSHKEMLFASIISFEKGDNHKLEEIFKQGVIPLTAIHRIS